jgi:predicted amidohydrolase
MSPFTIAAAQSSSIKGAISQNVRRHAELVMTAREQQADVVVFPELSLTGYEPTIAADVAVAAHDSVLAPLRELSENAHVVIMAGCPIRSVVGKPYIGILIFQPGRDVVVYRKRFVHSSEERYFVASGDTVVLDACGTTIGVAICADIKNPVHPADVAKKGAKVYAAGVAKTPPEMDEAEANMAAHAKKHGMLTVMANHATATGDLPMAGRSAIWDETGRAIAQAAGPGECIVVAEQTPAGWIGRVVGPELARE